MLIDESVSKVQQGVSKVQETNHAFEAVNEKVTIIGTALEKVVLSIHDQQQSVAEVAQAVSNLDTNIQSNAALVEETSAAAESLKVQATLLDKETNKFVINEAIAADLIESSSDIGGVSIADVRQSMRIWRTNAQSYLNGVNIDIDLEKAVDPVSCTVGQALAQMVQNMPSLQSKSEYLQVQDLHVRQHQLVRHILALMDESRHQKGVLNKTLIKEKDGLLDEFVVVTNQLDAALARLDKMDYGS